MKYYSEQQLQEFGNRLVHKQEKIVVGYCRVSSNKQKDDLERQIENVKNYLIAQGKPFEIITDVGRRFNSNCHRIQL
ncbi:putative site-specific integrase-resolvase [Desulfitispora alkaliphila]